MIWGWIKAYYRQTCTYSYNDLKSNLPDAVFLLKWKMKLGNNLNKEKLDKKCKKRKLILYNVFTIVTVCIL